MLELKTPPFIYDGDYWFVEDRWGGEEVSRFKVYKLYTDIKGSWIRDAYVSVMKFETSKRLGSELTVLDVFDLLEVLKSTPNSEALPGIRDYIHRQYLI